MDNFKTYMDQFVGVNHRFGDLASDIKRDQNFPEGSDFRHIYSHLMNTGASERTVDTFIEAWASYKKYPTDQAALHIAMMVQKLDSLTKEAGRIAKALETLADIQDPENPLISISDEVEGLSDRLLAVTYENDLGNYINVGGRIYTV